MEYSQYIDQLNNVIKQDLSILLNTKNQNANINQKNHHTVLNYGIPDLSALNPKSKKDIQYIIRTIKQSVNLFEPRLSNIKIECLKQKDAAPQKLTVRIEGNVETPNEKQSQSVSFTTIFNPEKPHFVFQ